MKREDVIRFANWLAEHEMAKKEDYWLYKPFPHEDLKQVGHKVGWATASEMLDYFTHKYLS